MKARDENEGATGLDAKRAELEEKTRFAASFKATCVRATEYHNGADEMPSERGRQTKEEMPKKRQEYQESKKKRSRKTYSSVKKRRQHCAIEHNKQLQGDGFARKWLSGGQRKIEEVHEV